MPRCILLGHAISLFEFCVEVIVILGQGIICRVEIIPL